MTLHRVLCRLGIHEWGLWAKNFYTGRMIRGCWCCGANQERNP
jgi:hypothetical protein